MKENELLTHTCQTFTDIREATDEDFLNLTKTLHAIARGARGLTNATHSNAQGVESKQCLKEVALGGTRSQLTTACHAKKKSQILMKVS
mmetsp:Transcript_3609/g.7981  ORF Transcript_3609/g.7981 Transcript_3609/m.7981 type:complete len:89 (+) Transcript_3609:692-958(+)